MQEADGSGHALAHEMPLMGIEVGSAGVQIMLGENLESRMEHDIPNPVALQPVSGEDGRQIGLLIRAADGSTTTLTLA